MPTAASGEDSDLGGWGWVKSIASWLVLLAVLVVLALTVVVPRLTGATPYTVLTGSMEPTYPPGTLIVVKSEDPAALTAGDVITFQKESGKLDVVTHRIIEIRANARGEQSFVTQGDANPSRDTNPVVPGQIRGKLWYSVPFMGYVNSLITGQQRSVLIVVVVGGLFLYAGYMFVGALRDRSRKDDAVAAPAVESAVTPADGEPSTVPIARVAAPVRPTVHDAETVVIPRIESRRRTR
ncbi:signal peptidase I [Rhodococcus sp. NPDC054953]